ncbi:Hcp family type VI secretion system effector [Providencia stuartii]|uniref:Hcp family type VI secretion system effector n=1 Tax=Providencia stuartii TaxID=588 RepID=UPI0024B07486
MSDVKYLKLIGKNQGLISAGCSTLDSIGNRYQESHKDQIQVLDVDYNISRMQNSVHHPILFTKPIDKSSPLLGVAVSKNELLDAEFSFYRISQSGKLERYFEIKLTKATIVDFNQSFPEKNNRSNIVSHEKILLNYESISWNHITAGTSGYSISHQNTL